jgi:hypothetical protein
MARPGRAPAPEAEVGALPGPHHLVRYTPRWSDRAVRRFVRRVGARRIDDLLKLYAADTLAKDPPAFRDVAMPPEVAALRERIDRLSAEGMAVRVRDLAITGEEVIHALGIAPGPEVGRALSGVTPLNRRDRLRRRSGRWTGSRVNPEAPERGPGNLVGPTERTEGTI